MSSDADEVMGKIARARVIVGSTRRSRGVSPASKATIPARSAELADQALDRIPVPRLAVAADVGTRPHSLP